MQARRANDEILINYATEIRLAAKHWLGNC
jgi:hypothetical protein